MFSKGDRVILKNHPHQVPGEVVDVEFITFWNATIPEKFLVKYDDTTLIPPEAWHSYEELIPCLPSGVGSTLNLLPEKRCECGSEKVGSDRHSEYCPKYEKD